MERQAREKKRKNIIIKRLEVKSGKRRETVEKVMDRIGIKINVKKIKRIKDGRKKNKEMVVVKVEGKSIRKKSYKKRKLKKKKERN